MLTQMPLFETKTPLDVERMEPFASKVVRVKVVFAAFFTAAGCAVAAVAMPKQSIRRIENIFIGFILLYSFTMVDYCLLVRVHSVVQPLTRQNQTTFVLFLQYVLRLLACAICW